MEIKDYKMSYYETMKHTDNKSFDLDNYVGQVLHGTNQDAVIKGREAKQKGDIELYKKIKDNSKCVTGSGTIDSGKPKTANNITPNGLICIDIDEGLDAKKENYLYNDPYSLVVHKSFGGDGVCLFIRINTDNIKDAYTAISKYYYDNYDIRTDAHCSNINRLRFISYDPDILVNNKAKVFNVKIDKRDKEPAKPLTNYVYTKSDFSYILDQIRDKHLDICSDYYSYFRVGLGFAREFGEAGKSDFHFVCSFNSKYDSDATDRDYKAWLKYQGDATSIGTFYYYCKEKGVDIYTQKTRDIINRVNVAKSQGSATVDNVVENLKIANNIDANEEDLALIKKLIDSKQDFSKLANADLTEIEQLANFIVDAYNPTIDEITQAKQVNNQRMEDRQVDDIYLACKKNFDFNVSKTDILSILNSSYVSRVNVLKEFIRDNSELKPEGYIDQYASFIHPQNEYNKWAFKKWIVGSMHNWFCDYYDPEPCPLTLVLTGQSHGVGKCLGIDTPVLIHDGSVKKVQDVVVGDKLMGEDGSVRNVLSLARGREVMYKISQNKSDSYVVNESHILSLKNRDNHNTVNVSVKDYILWSKSKKYRHVGYRGSVLNDSDNDFNVSPYMLGLWLGDGCSSLKKHGFCIENMDDKIIDYINKYAINTNHLVSVNINKKSKSNGYRLIKTKGRGNGVKNDKTHIKHQLISLNLDNNKHIPTIYKLSSRKQRLELLAGLIDSDGHLAGSASMNYEITQKNITLSNDIVYLCRSLGFRAVMSEKIVNNTVYYRIVIGGCLKDVPVLLDRKKIYKNNFYRSDYSSIQIERLKEDDYYGFVIDGNHLFMLGDFTVTHNTSFFRNLMPKEIRGYLIESKLSMKDKDSMIRMGKSLVIIDNEFGGKAFKDDKEFKDVSDQTHIVLRVSYGREDSGFRRRASLGGTTNEIDVLKDVTGNRRILPILVESTDYDAMVKFDKTSLIMEAYNLYKSGFEWRVFSEEDKQYIYENTKHNQAILPMEELFFMYFSTEQSLDHNCEVVMNQGEVLQFLNINSGMKPNKFEVAEVFKKNKFEYKSYRMQGKVKSGVKLFMNSANAKAESLPF